MSKRDSPRWTLAKMDKNVQKGQSLMDIGKNGQKCPKRNVPDGHGHGGKYERFYAMV